MSKILILDFDHTCYDTDDFLLNEIRNPILSKFNIPIDIWEKSYNNTVHIGYSLEKHFNELNKIMTLTPNFLEEIENFDTKINFSKYLYPEVASFLKEAKNKGYTIVILSFGAIIWQDKKIIGSGLNKLVDFVEYVTSDENNSKTEIVCKYSINSNKVIYVDNKGSNLDFVHKKLPQVETYIINRVPNDAMNFGDDQTRVKYLESRMIAESKTIFNHKSCQTFNEIIL